jgi:hypothetical protein
MQLSYGFSVNDSQSYDATAVDRLLKAADCGGFLQLYGAYLRSVPDSEFVGPRALTPGHLLHWLVSYLVENLEVVIPDENPAEKDERVDVLDDARFLARKLAESRVTPVALLVACVTVPPAPVP